MQKKLILGGGVVLVVIIVVLAVLFSGSGEQKPEDNQNQGQENNPEQEQQQDKDRSSSGEGGMAEIVGEIEKNGVPIPEFGTMKEVRSEESQGDNFSVIYSTNQPDPEEVKDFYQENLGDDWELDSQQKTGGQTLLDFIKGDNFELKVVLMSDPIDPGSGNGGMSINYNAPYKEDPYPSAVNVTPTSEDAEKYHNDLTEVFDSIFGGSKLVNTGMDGAIDLDYVVKEPITVEGTTEIRNKLTDKGYDLKDVSKDQTKAEYKFKKTYGDWSEVNLDAYIGEFANKAQEVSVTVWP